METYLNTAIKDVITEFPEVGTILAEYQVDCVTCQVGTCLLKDVLAIHALAPETEREARARMAEAITPGSAAAGGLQPAGAAMSVVATASAPDAELRALKYSPPMRELVEEHKLIMRWVDLIPRLLAVADLDVLADREQLLSGIDFIRTYADRFHHAKEEDILFGYFDESQEVIQVMLADHEAAREQVRRTAQGLDARDAEAVSEHLAAYGSLLTAHIKHEDELLYPWMDRELATSQIGELFSRFAAVDQDAGAGFSGRYAALVTSIGEAIEDRELRARESTTQKVEEER